MPGPLRSAGLQLRAAKRLLRGNRAPLRVRLGRLDERLVFVLGSPRSGTTFLAGAIGSLPGFIDLGEVAALKAAIPELSQVTPEAAAPELRTLLRRARRLGLVGRQRGVEQTPESVFVAPALAAATTQVFPTGRPPGSGRSPTALTNSRTRAMHGGPRGPGAATSRQRVSWRKARSRSATNG
jgi:hypothetical protein